LESSSLSKVVLVLSGFPCCIHENPPTETDGPPGTYAIARAAYALGHQVIVVTDDCNKDVFAAAIKDLSLPPHISSFPNENKEQYTEESYHITLETFPPVFTKNDEERFMKLSQKCDLLISCERAGPAKDGKCYTMRGIDMNGGEGKQGMLIAPLHRFVKEVNVNCKTISIGDGGNELGMGKVIEQISNNPKIPNGSTIGCVIPADLLISASVSNWGGYALAASVALIRAKEDHRTNNTASINSDDDGAIDISVVIEKWVERCVPTVEEEVALLDRCVVAGCRDGVSGKLERTVDGMPLETSLQCLRDIRNSTSLVHDCASL